MSTPTPHGPKDAAALTQQAGDMPAGASPPVLRTFAKYDLVSVLGSGGMGTVYKAWHPGLQCHYALKLLNAGDQASAETVKRFLGEAQALARLRHPGIVAVHDVGESEGKAFIAMEFVEGKTLESARDLPIPELLSIVGQIAEAIQFAHDAGVLHRDLKPANVLRVAADGRVKVMDFGLAKLVDATDTRITHTGAIMGTPAYMSPEGVEGGMKTVDAQSDVYQIGAIFYELLTGRRPYDGETLMEILYKVQQEDPPPPRRLRPEIPPDVETVCLAAMARERRRRYPSARALADDCRRLREGQAIRARPETRFEKGARWARRRKALTALVAVLLVSVLAVSGVAWRLKSAEREKAELQAQLLRSLRSVARTNLDAILSIRRLGGKMDDAEAKFAGPLREAAAAAIQQSPKLAEPHYHLGRTWRALLNFDAALAEQNRALAKEPGYLPSLYERATLGAIRYGDRLRHPDEAANPETAKLGGQIAADLAALDRAGADPEAHGLSRAAAACARGMFLLYGSKSGHAERGQARALLDQALHDDPTLEEAYEALARIAIAADDHTAAIAALSRGIEQDRGYFPFWLGRGVAQRAAALERQMHGEDPTSLYTAAVSDLSHAVELEPTLAQPWSARAATLGNWGLYRRGQGEDPRPQYRSALQDLDRSLAIEPCLIEALTTRGTVNSNLGVDLRDRGEDPGPSWQQAEADLTAALKLDPARAETLDVRGTLRMNLATFREALGEDPGTGFTAAIADYDAALKRNPEAADYLRGRGDVRVNWGLFSQQRGDDPGSQYGAAREDYRKALAVEPKRADVWTNLGVVLSNWSVYRKDRGEDPTALYREAVEAHGKALEINPASAEGWTNRATAQMNWGIYLQEALGQDPCEHYAAAEADFAQAVERNPRAVEAWKNRGMLHTNWGIYRQGAGQDPGDLYRKADADYEAALGIHPDSAEVLATRASLRLAWGSLEQEAGRDPSARYRGAEEDIAAVLKAEPVAVEAWIVRAHIRQNLALYRSDRKEDPGPDYAAAIEAYTQALQANPNAADVFTDRGQARANWGRWKDDHLETAADLYRDALGDFERALVLLPEDVDALWKRGWVRHSMGEWAQAVSDFEAAEKRDPTSIESYRDLLAEARKKLGAPAADEEWVRLLRDAAREIQGGHYRPAGELYAAGLEAYAISLKALAPEARATREAAARATLADVHYNLACVLALASAGKDGPVAPARAVAPDAAAKLRDGAFENLRNSVELGFKDVAHLTEDADFSPLHADPRWSELAKSLRAERK